MASVWGTSWGTAWNASWAESAMPPAPGAPAVSGAGIAPRYWVGMPVSALGRSSVRDDLDILDLILLDVL